ncbi:hypothetical protein AB4U70_002915 [Salmonella enterica]|uniref:Uncharacterized protein n=1 Tax=Salmonella enterica TaxID=28901 RepID=A0A762GMA7_SALER|nr:hypothetical protein [Salmonella enterica]EDM9771403.1 hypothetical protein [Salmonella enterica subsp. enterica serovar Corvallis]EHB7347898.1 hypothetical protein [Salmonella enterica subsp. enterica serovar Bracknell]MLP06341.1 hypothetical protein [Salmonella enterica subsp. enterica serovar Kedougou]EIS0682965.1 hypothetical protein [Salmonella enterica]
MAILQSLSNTKEKILNIIEPVPELGEGVEVIIKKLSIDDLIKFQEQFVDDKKQPIKVPLSEQMLSLLNITLVNEDDEPISNGDVDVIRQALSGSSILRLYTKSSELNGFSRKEVEAAKK